MNPGVIVIIVCLFSDVFLFFFFLGHWALPFLALAPGTCSLASLHSFFFDVYHGSFSVYRTHQNDHGAARGYEKFLWSWGVEVLSWKPMVFVMQHVQFMCSLWIQIFPHWRSKKNAPVIIPQSYFRTKGTGGYIDVPNHGLDFRLKKNSGFAVI